MTDRLELVEGDITTIKVDAVVIPALSSLLKGTGIYAYVIPGKPADGVPHDEIEAVLKQQVRKAIGPIATPDCVQVVPGLPKTRSGKIMRRILRKIGEGNYTDLGDITTLAEPQVVEQIVQGHKNRK